MPRVTRLTILLAAAEGLPRLHQQDSCADGDFADAVLRHEASVRRLVHRLLGWPKSATDTDDIVQDVLLCAWRHRGRFRGDAQHHTWLVRIGINTTRSHQRRRTLLRRVFGSRPEVDATDAPAPSPPDEHEAKASTVRQAMARLRHADREILVLRYLEQMSVEQLAASLRVSRNALDVRLSRARQRLRDLLPEAVDA